MGRAPCCDKGKVKRGPWSPEEDSALKSYVQTHGSGGNWIALPHKAGLKRCGKSCRLRWLNYLRPDIKHGGFTQEEDSIICTLYKSIGSRWSVIASQLPGRTDNDVKNYWNTKLKKKLLAGETISTNNTIKLICSSSSSSLSSSSPTVLTKYDQINNYSFSSTCFDHNSTTFSHTINVGLEQSANHSQRLVSDPIHYDQIFPIMEATQLGKSSDNSSNNYIVSSCQEVNSSMTPSSFNLDENCFFWDGNGSSEEDSKFSMQSFGFNSYSDISGFFGFHDRTSIEATATLANSLCDNILGDPF